MGRDHQAARFGDQRRTAAQGRLDFADPVSVSACLAGEGPVAVYLALPPAVFPVAVAALQQAGLPAESQVVLEKPFGEDVASARALLEPIWNSAHIDEVEIVWDEEAWRVLTPVLEGWSRDRVPLAEYDAGSSGPPRR